MKQPIQKAFLLVFNQYTASKLANERIVDAMKINDDYEPTFQGTVEEDIFPAWASESNSVEFEEGRNILTNNLGELNALLAEGWTIHSTTAMPEQCSCLIILTR